VDPRCLSSSSELDGLQVRCMELHVYAPGGGLADPKHFDGGSVVTVDIMLEDTFTKGGFRTPEGDDGEMVEHRFELGDALVFPSGKYHGVDAVASGCRKVKVYEERACRPTRGASDIFALRAHERRVRVAYSQGVA